MLAVSDQRTFSASHPKAAHQEQWRRGGYHKHQFFLNASISFIITIVLLPTFGHAMTGLRRTSRIAYREWFALDLSIEDVNSFLTRAVESTAAKAFLDKQLVKLLLIAMTIRQSYVMDDEFIRPAGLKFWAKFLDQYGR